MKMFKHYFNAVMYDIFNWVLNISVMMFLWKIDHFYAILIGGLFILRFMSSIIFNYTILRDKKETEQKLLQAFQKMQINNDKKEDNGIIQ